jgi:hypothetical protein
MDGHPAGTGLPAGGQNPAYRPARHHHLPSGALKCRLACGFVLAAGRRWRPKDTAVVLRAEDFLRT